MVRAKPTPFDPYSLPQAYQRWDYRDYATVWNDLAEAGKVQWEIDARPYHMTGFNYFMRSRLTNLSNLLARWHLDAGEIHTAPDTSKNGNHATIFGASPCSGRIGGGLQFDGIDDYCQAPHDESLTTVARITIEAFIMLLSTQRGGIVAKMLDGEWTGYNFEYGFAGSKRLYFFSNAIGWVSNDTDIEADGKWHHVAVTMQPPFAAGNLKFYLDGVPDGSGASASLGETTRFLLMGVNYGNQFLNARLDEIRIENRPLSAAEILTHSLRRYDLQ